MQPDGTEQFFLGLVKYTARVQSHEGLDAAPLEQQHEIRLTIAQTCLPTDPLSDIGIEQLVAETVRTTSLGLDPAVLEFLPGVGSDLDYEGPK